MREREREREVYCSDIVYKQIHSSGTTVDTQKFTFTENCSYFLLVFMDIQ